MVEEGDCVRESDVLVVNKYMGFIYMEVRAVKWEGFIRSLTLTFQVSGNPHAFYFTFEKN